MKLGELLYTSPDGTRGEMDVTIPYECAPDTSEVILRRAREAYNEAITDDWENLKDQNDTEITYREGSKAELLF
jgi:hypothetical protein